MSKYVLRISAQYEQDFSQKMDYITYKLLNPDAAKELYWAADKAVSERLDFAESFEPYHSRKDRKNTYYRIYVKNFEIYYVVIEENGIKYMELRRFLYQGENRPEKV